MKTITITSNTRTQIIDITAQIQKTIKEQNWQSGILTLYSPHTTAAISVNENADPAVKKDMNGFLKKLIPQESGFSHLEGNSDAHIKGSLVGFSQTFIVENTSLKLGTWQGIYFMEFDGPRQREVWLKFISEK